MNSNNLKPESYLANQRRIHGISLNLLDANLVSNFRKGRSRQKKLKNKYIFKFKRELPDIIEEISPSLLLKLSMTKAELLQQCLDLMEGYPGNEVYQMYISMARLKTSTGKINHILELS